MKSRALVAGLLAAGLTGAVQAEEQGFYAGVGAGMYYVDIDDLDFDESAATLRAFGGFQFNQYLSVEAGFTNLFEASTNVDAGGLEVGMDVDGSAWDISVRPSFPVSDTFTVYGVLGWTEWDIDVSFDLSSIDDVLDGVSASMSDSGGDLHYGLGGVLTINDAWNVRGEWRAVDVDNGDFGMFSLSAVYRFR